jgi:hypothetical protein
MSFSLEGYFGNFVTQDFFKIGWRSKISHTFYILLSLKISFFFFFFYSHLLAHSRPPPSLLIIFSFFSSFLLQEINMQAFYHNPYVIWKVLPTLNPSLHPFPFGRCCTPSITWKKFYKFIMHMFFVWSRGWLDIRN